MDNEGTFGKVIAPGAPGITSLASEAGAPAIDCHCSLCDGTFGKIGPPTKSSGQPTTIIQNTTIIHNHYAVSSSCVGVVGDRRGADGKILEEPIPKEKLRVDKKPGTPADRGVLFGSGEPVAVFVLPKFVLLEGSSKVADERVKKPLGFYAVFRPPKLQPGLLGIWRGTWANFITHHNADWFGSGGCCVRADTLHGAILLYKARVGKNEYRDREGIRFFDLEQQYQ